MKENACRRGAFLLCLALALLTIRMTDAAAMTETAAGRLNDPSDNPPPQPATAVAQWEPMTGVLIKYPLQIPMTLVASMSHVVEVMSEVTSLTQARTALRDYAHAGVDTSNCSFLICVNIGPYTRDHGPWYMFDGREVQGMVAPQYWSQIPLALGDTLDIPVYVANFSADGGNYMTDGMGNALATDHMYSGNPFLTRAEVDSIFQTFLGIAHLYCTPHPFPAVLHIDTQAKYLDPGRLLVIQPSPPNTVLEANVQYWSTLISAYGRPLEIIRVPGLGYCNSLILNDHVFVALNGNPAGDSTAMEIFREAMPGYVIEGYTYPTFTYLDALHCRTHEMADRYMLRITHVPAFDQVNNAQGYLIKGKIHPYSNQSFVNGTPVVKWKLQEAADWNTLPMISLPADSFSATIPLQQDNSVVQYYIHAEDNSGRSENHPYIGSANPHDFQVLQADPVALDLAPQGTPIVIPPQGGSFSFTLQLTNATSLPLKFDLWTGVTLPGGGQRQILLCYNLSLPMGGSLSRNLTQMVPGYAPAGSYTYWARAGLNPQGSVWAEDAFPFSKSGAGVSGDLWELLGWETAPISALTNLPPPDCRLLASYPNPFNPTTVARFELRDASYVSLQVYDISGRLVATLADGWREAGAHEVMFDGSGLPSGVYLYRVTTGTRSETGKMILLK